MKFSIIIIGIVFILILGAGIFIYFYNEKPNVEKPIEYNNITIRFLNYEDNKQINSKYIISIIPTNTIYKEGEVGEEGFLLERIPLNNSFRILSNNDKYYNNYSTFIINENDINKFFRADIYLHKIGNISYYIPNIYDQNNINNTLTWKEVNNFNITLKSIGYFQNIAICTRGSGNIISIKLLEYTEIPIPITYLNKVDHCYSTLKSLNNNEELNITLNYKTFGKLNSGDYITFIILDGDYDYADVNTINYENIKAVDVIYKIT